jgi:alpha-tubulin suppressor-like RCC1 family protein
MKQSIVIFILAFAAVFAQLPQTIGYFEVVGKDSVQIPLRVISVANATAAANGVVKIVLPGGAVGAADLVDTTTAFASPVRIFTTRGTKAFRKMIPSLAGGYVHSAMLKGDGTLWTSGYNAYGQIGDGTNFDRWLPVRVAGTGGTGYLNGIVGVACGYNHTIALELNGKVWSFGDNTYGQLGDSTTTARNSPVRVRNSTGTGNLNGVGAVASGYYHSLAIKSDGSLYSWGRNDSGQLGDATNTQRLFPVHVVGSGGVGYLDSIVAAAGGNLFTVALRADGSVWSFGANNYGQLGDGTTTPRNTPSRVKGEGGVGNLAGIVAIAAGYEHCLALKSDGSVYSWGRNDLGQLGDNSTTNRYYPVKVAGIGGVGFLANITGIGCGRYHSAAMRADSTTCTWGDNAYGQLGKSSSGGFYYTFDVGIDEKVPVIVHQAYGDSGNFAGVYKIVCGAWHTLALKWDGTFWGWGNNYYGALGDSTTADRSTPVWSAVE